MASPRPRRIDLIAACLTAGIEQAGLEENMATMLSDPAMDFERFARLAGRHLVTPMLKDSLFKPQTRSSLPEDFIGYLDVTHEQNRLRNTDLRRQIAEIAHHLNLFGIEPLLLKGAIRLADDLYPDIGWRFMRDLDILIPPERISDTVTCLQDIGYRFIKSRSDWPEQHHHLPPLYRENERAVVELHTELLSRNQVLCREKDVRPRSRSVALDGAIVRLPEAADQLAHLIGHDLTDGFLRRSAMIPLRSLFEIALLCRNESALTDVLERCQNAGLSDQTGCYLGLAARFFPNQIATLPKGRLGARMRIRGLSAMELLDENGRIRRFVWFARLRCSKLLRLPAERRHVAANLLSQDYYHRALRRVRRLWMGD